MHSVSQTTQRDKRICLALRLLPSQHDSPDVPVTHEMNGTAGWPVPSVKWQMREMSTNQKEDTPIMHGALGEWVICYRFECITRTDVNISGVKAETSRFIRTSVSLLCMFNMSWEETKTILSYYWSETEELSLFSKMKNCHQKTSENRYDVYQGFHAKEHA